MAVRIRQNGRIFCAALHPTKVGDIYIDDGLHYKISVEQKILVTECHEQHMRRGEWWWRWNVPDNVIIDDFYC